MFGRGLLVNCSHMLFAVDQAVVCIPAISAVQFLVYRLLLLFGRRRIEPFLRGLGYCSSCGLPFILPVSMFLMWSFRRGGMPRASIL